MGRRKKTEEVVEEEVINLEATTEESTESVNEINESTEDKSEVVEDKPIEEDTPVEDENPDEQSSATPEDNATQEDASDSDPIKESDDNIEDASAAKVLSSEGEEVLVSKVSILEHTFDKKIKEVAVFDVYQKGDLWQFRDKNGSLINSSFCSFDSAMRIFVARLFPVERRAKGTTYSWTKLN